MPLGKIGDVFVGIRGDASKLRGDLANARGQVRGALGSFAGVAKVAIGAAVGIAASLAAKGIQALLSQIQKGKQLNDWAIAIGDSVENLSRLTGIGRLVGIEAQEIVDAIISMQQTVAEAMQGDEGALRILMDLGLNLEDLKAMTPTEQLWAFIHALQNVEDPALRAKLAAQLFGEDALRELGPLLGLSKEEVAKLSQEVEDLGLTMTTSQAEAATAITVEWEKLKAKFQAKFVLPANSLLPVILRAINETGEAFHVVETVNVPGLIRSLIGLVAQLTGVEEQAKQTLTWLDRIRGGPKGVLSGLVSLPSAVGMLGSLVGKINEATIATGIQPTVTNIQYGDNYGTSDFEDEINMAVRAGDRSGLPRARNER